jgi:hypothetical protein
LCAVAGFKRQKEALEKLGVAENTKEEAALRDLQAVREAATALRQVGLCRVLIHCSA